VGDAVPAKDDRSEKKGGGDGVFHKGLVVDVARTFGVDRATLYRMRAEVSRAGCWPVCYSDNRRCSARLASLS
jgi:hypothetical protein